MSTGTHKDIEKRLHIIFDESAPGVSGRYEIRFEGRQDKITSEPGESPGDTWARVLSRIANLRWLVRVGNWPGNPDEYATVYEGVTPTEDQERKHQRDHLSSCLYRIGQDRRSSGMARVQAYAALIELHGLAASRPESMFELIRAEKNRRAQMRTLERSWQLK